LESLLVLKPKPAPAKWAMKPLVAAICEALCALPDARKGGNNQRYTMGDAGVCAFSVFFMQSPSFLDFQVRMQQGKRMKIYFYKSVG
jgi:ABC-type sugar transport system ATPase subunit